MAEHKAKLRTKVAMGVAGLTLFFAQIACGGASKIDPCDETFLALQTAASNSSLAGRNLSENSVEFGPSLPGIATHPDVKGYPNWSRAVAFLITDCGENYSVKFAGDEYDFSNGVTVKRKPAQSFSLPEQSLNWVTGMLVATMAVLGIGALGLGGKKLIGA